MLIKKEVFEIALPSLYIRDKTLFKAFVILDETQNTTSEQMMMLSNSTRR